MEELFAERDHCKSILSRVGCSNKISVFVELGPIRKTTTAENTNIPCISIDKGEALETNTSIHGKTGLLEI